MFGTYKRSRHNKRWHFAIPLRLEFLEQRDQPSAGFRMNDSFADLRNAPVEPAALINSYFGLTPSMVRNAYGFNQVSLTGAGQTIAIITAYDHPTIEDDLATFNRMFGLPNAPTFTRVSDIGTPRTDTNWAIETAMDVQWAHAIAPAAGLMLVQARSNQLSDMLDAVNYARNQPNVSVISMSWGLAEFSGQSRFDRLFTTPNGHSGVSFVAASGDFGSSQGAMWPASSPNVLAVGGTRLTTDISGNYQSESAWTLGTGGVSINGSRQVPDVSYAADPKNGFFVYSSGAKKSGWYTVGGTSAGAPQWAGLVAIANQGRVEAGLGPIHNVRAAISQLTDAAFHDVVDGSNGFVASKGFDLATGRGSPIASITIEQLMSDTMPTPAPFVGPLPDATTAPKQTTRVPIRLDGALAQVAAESARQLATHFTIDSQSQREFAAASIGRDQASDQTPANAPLIVAPTTSVSAIDLSRWGAGDSWEDEQAVPPAEAVPAAAVNVSTTSSRVEYASPRLFAQHVAMKAMNAGWNVVLGPRSTLIPEAEPHIINDRASPSPLMLAFLAGGYVLTSEKKERQRAKRMGN